MITIAEMAVFGEVILRSPLYVLGVIVSDQDSYIIIARNDQEEVKIKIEDIQI